MMPRILALTLLVAALVFAPLAVLGETPAMAHSAGTQAMVSIDHCGHAVTGEPTGDKGTQADQDCATMCAVQGTETQLPDLEYQPSSVCHEEWQQMNLGSAPEQELPPPR